MKRLIETPKCICQKALYEKEQELKTWVSRLNTDNRTNRIKSKIRMCERYIKELNIELEELNG